MTNDVVHAARQSLGSVGAALANSVGTSTIGEQRDAVRRLEAAGYPTAWRNEGIGGRDVFVNMAILLAETEHLVLASGIANVWSREPQTAHGASCSLAEAFPGRFVLGIGSGYPFQAEAVGREFGKPLANMRDYLSKMTGPAEGQNAVSYPYAKIVAANGPKMLELSRDLADGATPSVVPPQFTAAARATLGPDKLLAVGLIVFLDDDRDRARATAQQTMVGPWSFPGSPYGANLRRLGYAADDVATAATAVLDDVVAYGDATAIAAKVDEHLSAGADHVILTVIGDIESGVQAAERLAPSVLSR